MSTDNPTRFDAEVAIHDVFMELRKLYQDGHAARIEAEIAFMTGGAVHRPGDMQCLLAAKDADAFVFDPEADVISEHLTNGNEITDLAAEAIVRRLANPQDHLETAHFNSWLELIGFEMLKRVR